MDTISNHKPPIVCVLGHVDHGKTTLPDAIRKTNVASREAGGITQSIGASQITTKDGKVITFIDTPGHAAFSAMRSRGATVSDIAILVVAADDGVQPQTKEALKYIQEAKVPFIVAITKVDLASASVDSVLGQLEKEGVYFEGRGGQVPHVEISAKLGTGIDHLLELINLLFEVGSNGKKTGSELGAVVIETSKTNTGLAASVIVISGTLKVNQEVWTEGSVFKIRGLLDDHGKAIENVTVGYPAVVLGFEILPAVGSIIKEKKESEMITTSTKPLVVKTTIPAADQIPVFIKAKNTGSLEAVLANLPDQIVVVGSGVGDIFESDILNAKSQGVTYFFAFESKASPSIVKLAQGEGIKIESFKIIYELFTKVDELIKKGQVEILGKAEIIATFPFNNKKVAGCKVLSGKIGKSDSLVIVRGENELGKVRATTLKKQKQDIQEAKAGEEFGIILEPQLDFAIGDMLVSVKHG